MKRVLVVAIMVLVLIGVAFWYGHRNVEAPTNEKSAPPVERQIDLSTTTPAYDITAVAPDGDQSTEMDTKHYIEGQVVTFIDEANRAYAEYEQREPDFPWRQYSFASTYQKYTTDGYIFYAIDEYHYTGGANGIQYFKSFNFSPDGTAISLTDIVPTEKRDALLVAVKEKLYQLNNISVQDQGVFGGAINDLTFDSLQNFFVTDTDLVIGFQKYEVAPGAAGTVRVTLPRADFVSL